MHRNKSRAKTNVKSRESVFSLPLKISHVRTRQSRSEAIFKFWYDVRSVKDGRICESPIMSWLRSQTALAMPLSSILL